jgi:hypothetical protein
MSTVDLKSELSLNRTLAREPGVRQAVRDQAEEIGRKAEARLSGHTHDGDSQITVTHGKTDSFVSLDDSRGQSAAMAIELGHTAPNGTYVPGLYVLASASGAI